MDERTDSPSTFEEQRIEIEREKLNVEKEGIKFERFKLITTSISVCVPLLALFATVFLGIWAQKQKDTNDFNLKAAEITLNTDNPWVTYNKDSLNKKGSLGGFFHSRLFLPATVWLILE